MNLSALRTPLLLASLLAFPTASHLCAQVNYGDYNFITYGDLSISSHVNTAAIVGGNLYVSGTNASIAQTRSDAHGTGIMVYGNVTAEASTNRLDFSNSANYYFANNQVTNHQLTISQSQTLNLQNAGNTLTTNPLATADYNNIGFEGLWSRVVKTSASFLSHADTLTLNDISSNGTTNKEYYNLPGSTSSQQTSYITFDLTKDLSLLKIGGISLFTSTGTGSSTVYTTANTVDLIFNNASATNKLVINVIGEAGSTFNFASYTDASAKSSVLWNFSGISNISLNTGREFDGSILAPTAAVTFTQSQNIYGQVFASSYYGVGGGEYHGDANFFTTDLGPIPEPSTYALFGAASCGALALLRRRRKAA